MPNFSEGRDDGLVAALAEGPLTLDVHSDPDHNRCVVTLAAASPTSLLEAVLAKVELAVRAIDLRRHSGVHPRVGAADVVPLVPLGRATLAEAAAAATELGHRIWKELGVPVYFYGQMAGGRRLADIRHRRATPDLGGPELHPSAGAVCVGARLPLVALNLTFPGVDLQGVRRLAVQMRRLPGVQALAFPLSDGRAQLSMNLTRLEQVGVPEACAEAARLAGVEGEPELVGLCPAAAAGPGCDGRLLEARLAALAARLAALAPDLQSEEQSRLAQRLEAEAASLGTMPARQKAILAGAERAAAMHRVLLAGGLGEPGILAILEVAAAGLRSALGPKTVERFAHRVQLLDDWLGEMSQPRRPGPDPR